MAPSVGADSGMVLAVDVVVVVDSPDALADSVGEGTGPGKGGNLAVHQDASSDRGDVVVVRLDDLGNPDVVVADARLDTVVVVVVALPVVVLLLWLVAPIVAAVAAEHPGPVAGVHSLPFLV